MNINMPNDPEFINYYQKHLKCLRLKGLQPKTIEAYSRAIRRIGNYFDCQIDNLSSDQLLDYFNELLNSHSWSAVKLDLYGLKFFYTNVLNKTWDDIPLVKPPRTTRIKALIYLGKYLYKGVIREKDILKCENGMVTFRYLDSKTRRYRTKTVKGEYFLYLLMLHVLPKGFRRTRNYGFLHSCSKKLIRFLQMVLRVNPLRILRKKKERPKITCPVCGAEMKIVLTMVSKPPGIPKVCFR